MAADVWLVGPPACAWSNGSFSDAQVSSASWGTVFYSTLVAANYFEHTHCLWAATHTSLVLGK